ncbi:L-rhamnose mutarotase [Pedobacter sp. CAN_A7]|uniref:L-rhamnose mutarotase n=1 Tax=Pedobacter sp. CAN_A7 TaxID=2787722 RepID=UPI0018CB9669
MPIRRFCLTLDLVNDQKLISEYEAMHRQVWPEIIQSIKNSGIANMEIYRFEQRLMMIMEVVDSFSFEKKNEADHHDEKVQEWERLMWKYQQAVPGAKPGEKWVLMNKVFEL